MTAQINRKLIVMMCVIILGSLFYLKPDNLQQDYYYTLFRLDIKPTNQTIITVLGRPPPPKQTLRYTPSSDPLPHPDLKLYTFEELQKLEKNHKIKSPDREMSGGGFVYKDGTLWSNGVNLSHVDDGFVQEDYEPITFISVVVNEAELAYNLLKSPAFTRFGSYHQWIIYNNRKSSLKVTQLYYDGWKRAVNDLLIFIHPDVWLGDSSLPFIYEREIDISLKNISWAALGTSGYKRILNPDGNLRQYVFRGQWCEFGLSFCAQLLPFMDDTVSLDEMLFIMRKKTNITFDPNLPGNHLYGLDLCMQALKIGTPCYSLSSHVFHKFRTEFGAVMDPSTRQRYFASLAGRARGEITQVAQYMYKKWKGRGVFPVANNFASFDERVAGPHITL